MRNRYHTTRTRVNPRAPVTTTSDAQRVADVEGAAGGGGAQHLQEAELEQERVLGLDSVGEAEVKANHGVTGLAPGVELALAVVHVAGCVFEVFDRDVP